MKFLLLFLLLSTYSVYSQEEEAEFYPPDSNVITEGDFETLLPQYENAFVEFYAPWCGHCQQIKPEIIKLAKMTSEINIPVIAIDATVHSELAQQLEVQGFPSLKFFKKGVPNGDYEGERTAENMFEWIQSRLLPAVINIKTVEEYEKIKKDFKVYLIAQLESDNIIKSYHEAAESMRDEVLFATVDEEFAKTLNIISNTIRLYGHDNLVKDMDSKILSEENFNAENIINFVEGNMFPIVGEIGAENFHRYLSRELPMFWIFTGEDKETNDNYINSVIPVAEYYKDRVLFVYLSGEQYLDTAEYYGLEAPFPAGVLIDDNKMNKFPFKEGKENMELNKLQSWIDDCINDKIKPFIRSEPIPENNDKDVKIVVRDSFEELVKKSKNDVFIMFYAPWCPHCKSLLPILDQVASTLSSTDITIAKMDGTANDVPVEYDIEGFPTMYYIKADDKENPILYESQERNLEELLDFLMMHSQNKKIGSLIDFKGLLSFLSEFNNLKEEVDNLLDKYTTQTEQVEQLQKQLEECMGQEPEEVPPPPENVEEQKEHVDL